LEMERRCFGLMLPDLAPDGMTNDYVRDLVEAVLLSSQRPLRRAGQIPGF